MSYKPGQKKDKGRTLTADELAEFLEGRPDLVEGCTEAQAKADGLRIDIESID